MTRCTRVNEYSCPLSMVVKLLITDYIAKLFIYFGIAVSILSEFAA